MMTFPEMRKVMGMEPDTIALLPSPAAVKGPLYLKDHGLLFDPKEHVYSLPDGTLYTGTTTVLKALSKEWLAGWAVKVTSEGTYNRLVTFLEQGPALPYRITRADIRFACDDAKKDWRTTSKDAMAVGTEVHKWIEAKRKGEALPPLTTDAAKKGTDALLDWESKHKVKILASEVVVCSHAHRVAGTLDVVAEIDGRRGLGDYKTSSGVYPEMSLQTQAYCDMYNEMSTELTPELNGRFIVRLDKKTGAFDFRWLDSPADFDSQVFWHLREVHRWLLLQERLAGERG